MKSLIQYLGITGFILPATASQIPSTFEKFFAFYPDKTTEGKNNEISRPSINLNRGNAASQIA
ncbi:MULTISPECIES: hypothetical protein [unclassified Microcoleus]|uniref:hypothetical protein n=1 Tax=unclassified Microcoleus TaxID=2642155 RepID=UPI002FCF8A79